MGRLHKKNGYKLEGLAKARNMQHKIGNLASGSNTSEKQYPYHFINCAHANVI